MSPADNRPVLCCDLGGTRLRVALVDSKGRMGAREVIPTPDDESESLVRALAGFLERASGPVAGAVVGVPGMVDYANGLVTKLPNLAAWESVISSANLGRALGLTVLLANDADLGALGENRFGAGRGTRDMVFVAAGTGVGAGVVINGRMLHARFSLAEIGHTIIEREGLATVEGLASGMALKRLTGMTVSELAGRAAAGDEEAARLFGRVTRDLGIAVCNLVHCFSPEMVVIGGGMTAAGEALLAPIRRMLRSVGPYDSTSQVTVALAETGDDAGLLGAAAYWTDVAKES